ncbi:MAG: hypothetical protein GDA43_07565 [Hormoscilla sp. SP5CHS1]|nr:hypothetical protein [Hormoscilla sp. SP12CHS1]MBC6453082.1 hypothetical protein [Hormoscilla sp. SP5CHS1]
MGELKILCKHPDSLKLFFQDMLAKELQLLARSIQRSESRLREFEDKYQLSTDVRRYENDEFAETLELDEWIGESMMLKRLRKNLDIYGGVKFVSIGSGNVLTSGL